MASREDWSSESICGPQVPSRAQGLRGDFEPTGVRIRGRNADGRTGMVEWFLNT